MSFTTLLLTGLVSAAPPARTEAEILNGFEDVALKALANHQPRLEAAMSEIRSNGASLERFVVEASRFAGATSRRTIDIYLVASPTGSKGVYISNRIALAVPIDGKGDRLTLLHELWHALVGEQRANFVRAIQGRQGVDVEMLNEAIAYAVQPGLFHEPEDAGALEFYVANRLRRHPNARGAGSARFASLGLALRPGLARAWRKGKLRDYLSEAAVICEAVVTMEQTLERAPRKLFVFGDFNPDLGVSVEREFHRGLSPVHLKDSLLKSGSHDAVALALIAPDPAAVPLAFADLFGSRWPEIATQLEAQPSGSIEVLDRWPRLFVWWEPKPGSGSRIDLNAPSQRARQSLLRLTHEPRGEERPAEGG